MSSSIRAFIVDDEYQSRNLLTRLLSNQHEQVQLVGQASTADEAFDSIRDVQPNLVFLDVMLNEVTGFDLLQRFPQIDFEVIFTTAHDQFALKAFKFNAVDYLLKPIDPDELELAIEKVKQKLITRQHTTKEQLENLYQSIKTPNGPG